MSRYIKKYHLLNHIPLIFTVIILSFPLYLMLVISLKTEAEILKAPFAIPQAILLSNYLNAAKQMNLWTILPNSIIITVGALVCLLLFGSMAAYPIARMPSKFSGLLYLFFLSGLTMPFQSAMIPLYKVMKGFDLINTHHGMILLYTATTIAFTIFLYVGFMKTIPKELEEAAMIDGCNRFMSYRIIIFPLLKTITATAAIFDTMLIWNDFLKPLLFFSGTNKGTIITSVYAFQSQYDTQWGYLFASCMLASLPLLILYLTLQKYFVKGIAAGAIKG